MLQIFPASLLGTPDNGGVWASAWWLNSNKGKKIYNVPLELLLILI
jgi:hypothetical protein